METTELDLSEILSARGLRVRGNKVLIRIVRKGDVRGLIMPETSQEGAEYLVVAMGKDAEKLGDLRVGDSVQVAGKQNEHWAYIPGQPDMLITNEDGCQLVHRNIIDDQKALGAAVEALLGSVPDAPPEQSETVEFDPNAFPDADLETRALTPEQRSAILEGSDSDLVDPDDQVFQIKVNGEDMKVIVKPGTTDRQVYDQIAGLCEMKYGKGKLHQINSLFEYHWK